jgi:DNA-binding NarL/FixJ family response regulator
VKTCLICDDHAMMREALAGTIELGWPGTHIMLASDYPSAWTMMLSGPSICITDLMMPGANPVDGVQRMRELAPDTPILVITGNEDDDILLELFALGVAGFAPKTSKSSVIEAAISLVLAGGHYVPPRILEIAVGTEGIQAPHAKAPTAKLTPRQIDVLRLIAMGQSTKEIARKLALSPATVKAHTAAAIAALSASNRTEAVVKARIARLI